MENYDFIFGRDFFLSYGRYSTSNTDFCCTDKKCKELKKTT